MRIALEQSFANYNECNALSAWALMNKDGMFHPGVDDGRESIGRWTTRNSLARGLPLNYPSTVETIRRRVVDKFGLHDFTEMKTIATIMTSGNSIAPHYDAIGGNEGDHLRINLLVSHPSWGGETIVDGIPVPMSAGDLVAYLANKHEHQVTEVRGDSPRIIFSYGWIVPFHWWELPTSKAAKD